VRYEHERPGDLIHIDTKKLGRIERMGRRIPGASHNPIKANGKVERFIQSALRESAYGIPYNHSSERAAMLERWMHHYNWHRPYQGIKGFAPATRLAQSRNSLLTRHS
jgi:transposase InsO family protein